MCITNFSHLVLQRTTYVYAVRIIMKDGSIKSPFYDMFWEPNVLYKITTGFFTEYTAFHVLLRKKDARRFVKALLRHAPRSYHGATFFRAMIPKHSCAYKGITTRIGVRGCDNLPCMAVNQLVLLDQ